MIILFHGDDTAKSRQQLKQVTVTGEKRELDGLKIAPKDLESTLATTNLFSSETIVIENLFSRLKSKDKDACIKLLTDYQGEKQILLWEKKELTKAVLTKLPKTWKISLSKLPALIFNFLESLYPGNLPNILAHLPDLRASTPDILLHTMISRQISYLILIKSASNPKFAPWQIGKLKSQASHWTDQQLVHFHDELLRIDYQIKSGQTKLDYSVQLDLLLASALG